ncbi:MAG: hypothetical protein AAF581_14205 [Planctomycetota bacterium]
MNPTAQGGYQHTQNAPLHWLLWGTASLLVAILSWAAPEVVLVQWLLLAMVVVITVFALSFMHLTVRDEGDRMTLRYGPLPLFSKAIRYDQIRSAKASRSTLIDGWGIHWLPGRGWTFNLWGFACAELELDRGTLRIGSDDVPRLVEFLQQRVPG